MKTVAKINPEQEYETAKKIIDLTFTDKLVESDAISLRSSVNNLILTTRVLMEREERRRGHQKTNPPKDAGKKGRGTGESREETSKRPTLRYPDLEINEITISPGIPPICPCCKDLMVESGLFDSSESLEVIPKKYIIQKSRRPKFRCSHCHGAMVNTSAPPSIVPNSNYGDSFIIDVSLSKFCDLIPIERYVQIAQRNGLENLPAQSLIGLTHHLANFLNFIYTQIKSEVKEAIVLQADETPHRMLEGDVTKNWYLWGFFSQKGCFFEAKDTRSGDVAFEVLKDSKAEYLMSDGYAGYGKAIKDVKRELSKEIIEVNCNAHAFRYFRDASKPWENETKNILKLYGEIYSLERERKDNQEKISLEEQLVYRKNMTPYFKEIKKECEEQKDKCMPGSSFSSAINYFLNHYIGLTRCTDNIEIPLDNNLSERELRAIVVGRKTWWGTHSKRGALTTAILFSIIQSCKLSGVNPRNYFPWVVAQIHAKKDILTPYKYSMLPSG